MKEGSSGKTGLNIYKLHIGSGVDRDGTTFNRGVKSRRSHE